MLTKAVTQVLFGTPYAWTQQYLDNCEASSVGGWDWIFFVDPVYFRAFRSTPHVRLVPMTLATFDALVEATLDVRVDNMLVGAGNSPALTGQPRSGDLWPRKVMSCYYPMHGLLFADWLAGYDFYVPYCNWDMVFGRLDRFYPDKLLAEIDMWSDEPNVVNGIWTICRNTPLVHNLFREIPDWQAKLAYPGPDNKYTLDEGEMSRVCPRAAAEGRLRFRTNDPYWHSHDTFAEHRHAPRVTRMADGGLWDDAAGAVGREIPMFHFKLTKAWPTSLVDGPLGY